jgi:hypothetical protein
MSTWSSCYIAASDRWTEVGPGLNAWNMRSRAWLDESRVWKSPADNFDEVVELRPLHHRDLPGPLAAELPGSPSAGPLLVELRVPERWDAAIPEATLLVHRFDENHSYLTSDTSGDASLAEGDTFEYGVEEVTWRVYGRVEVLSISAQGHTARIRLHHRPAGRLPTPGGAGISFGGIEVDGGGAILLNGRMIRIPPWSPLVRVIEQLAMHEMVRDTAARGAARRSALQDIASWAEAALDELTELESPPPPRAQQREGGRLESA